MVGRRTKARAAHGEFQFLGQFQFRNQMLDQAVLAPKSGYGSTALLSDFERDASNSANSEGELEWFMPGLLLRG